MICKNCGATIREGGNFCTSCGMRVVDNGSENNSIEEKATLITDDQENSSADNILNSLGSTETAAASESGSPVLTAQPPFESKEDIGTSSDENESPYFPPVAEAPKPQQINPDYVAPVMVAPKAKQVKANRGVTALVSILFGILIFVFIFASECLILANNALSKKSISHAIEQSNPTDTKIGALLEMESVKNALEAEGVNTEDFDKDTTLGDFLAALSIDFNMNGEDIIELFEETDIMEEFSAIAADYEEYLFTGEGGDYLSSNKVLSIIKNHRKEILNYTGVDISEYSDKIKATVDSMKNEIKGLNPENSMGEFGRIAYIFLSPVAIAVVLAFALLFTTLITTITKRFFAGVLTLGISSALSGLICLAAALLHSLIFSVVMPKGTGLDKLFSDLFKDSLFDDMLKISLIFLGVGVILIIVKIMQHIIVKNKTDNQPIQ